MLKHIKNRIKVSNNYMVDIKWYNPEAKKFNVHEKNGVVYLSSPILDEIEWLNNGFSTRIGGVSKGVCESMNFAYNDYDDPKDVARNYEIFTEAASIDVNRIVRPHQIHSSKVIKIESDFSFRDAKVPGWDFEGVDGTVTNVPGVTLFGFSADCNLISIVDPVNKAIGLCHAGWRGMASKISKETIDLMAASYGTKAEDVIASIAPSICPDCFEVEFDMIEQARAGFDESQYDAIYYKKNDIKYQFNLWEANRLVLLEMGVKEENIFLPNLCTKCNPKLLFSHRNSGLKRGTLISYLSIKE